MTTIERLEALEMKGFMRSRDETVELARAVRVLLRVAKAAKRLADNGDLDPGFSPDACLLLALSALDEVTP